MGNHVRGTEHPYDLQCSLEDLFSTGECDTKRQHSKRWPRDAAGPEEHAEQHAIEVEALSVRRLGAQIRTIC